LAMKHITRKHRVSPGASKRQKGQILIIVAFAIIGLVAFVGLVVDTGLVFIGYGTLRRSVDAAALAAAAQYRKNPNPTGLEKAAKEFLVLNNVPNAGAAVYVCNENFPSYHDPSLCTTPARRRLVKVNASTQVPLAFLPVIGINSIPLHATATSEAASLDITLVLDVSESMSWDTPATSLMRDPSECNAARMADGTTSCYPFHNIQEAAMDFVAGPARNGVGGLITNDNAYDRISVIPFSHTVADDAANYNKPLHLDANMGLTPAQYRSKILSAIANLSVYQASDTLSAGPSADGSCLGGTTAHTPCRYYIPDDQLTSSNCGYDMVLHAATGGYDFSNRACFTPVPPGSPIVGSFVDPTDPNPATNHYERAFTLFSCDDNNMADRKYCGTSNIGGGFWAAGQEFVGKLGTHPNSFRQESLWVVILLTDGVANHSNGNLYCPHDENQPEHWCQDYGPGAVSTRHCLPADDPLYTGFPALFNACQSAPPNGGGGTVNSALFDADDYARAMADYVALGQQALIFTIGYDTSGLLGHNNPGNDYGEQLLSYAADVGDDGKINTVGLNPDYFYYDPHDISQSLTSIFQAITDQIATRLQK
jgi:hypothetical protein